MLDFAALKAGDLHFDDLIRDLDGSSLAALTNEMVDTMLGLIAVCRDEDVVFVPHDPHAHDPYAESPEEIEDAWTLGHVIVHATASAEEAAVLAAELARGVERDGRSRYEVDWRSVVTIRQCRDRLEESRRIRLASLELWPDAPHLDNRVQPWSTAPVVNCVGRFVLGLGHDASHLGQIEEIVRQAVTARS